MSLSIQQIILDAKRLAGRLKERESVADSLLNETQAINKQIESMKQYQEEVQALNEGTRQPHTVLIDSVQEMREMQQENQRLQAALDDHRRALEVIMTKYRQHVQKQIWNSRIDFKGVVNKRQQEIIKQQAEKISEMAAIMHRAMFIDDENIPKEKELLTQLVMENRGLRDMLRISKKYGSYGLMSSPTETQDKDVQTDAVISSNS